MSFIEAGYENAECPISQELLSTLRLDRPTANIHVFADRMLGRLIV